MRCHRHSPSSATAVEDLASATVEIDDRIQLRVQTGWGMALLGPVQANLVVYGGSGVATNHDYAGESSDGFGNMIDEFLASVEAGQAPDLALVDDTMALMYALYRSVEAGRAVSGSFAR